MRAYITQLHQKCEDSEMREKYTRIEKHLNIVKQATKRISSAAESCGAVDIEQRVFFIHHYFFS